MQIPQLTSNILIEIIQDAAELCPAVEAVGLVGSFLTEKELPTSDVDLLVKTAEGTKFSDVLDTFGEYVEKVLDNQFNKQLDIVRYDRASNYASKEPENGERWYYRQGFEDMLKNVRWLYERPNNN